MKMVKDSKSLAQRSILVAGDTVRMTGFASKPGAPRIGFGAVDGKVVG